MREPAPLVFFETECGPIPQSAARPITGSSLRPSNPFGLSDSAMAPGSSPSATDTHTSGARLGGSELRVAAEAHAHAQPLRSAEAPAVPEADLRAEAAGLVAGGSGAPRDARALAPCA